MTPSKTTDDKAKSPNLTSNNKKYAHIQSKVKTFWTPQEMQKKSLKQFFIRKGTSSASSSASNSTFTSPSSVKQKDRRRSLNFQFAENDFYAKLNEIRKGMLLESPELRETKE